MSDVPVPPILSADADAPTPSWTALDAEDLVVAFRALDPALAGDLFLELEDTQRAALIERLTPQEARVWVRLLPPDDIADLIQELPEESRRGTLELLDRRVRVEVEALLLYQEDDAGGKMNPRYARVSPEMTSQQAMAYLRLQAGGGQIPMIYYAYVLESDDRLVGVISFRELILAGAEQRVREIMNSAVTSVPEDLDQEALAQVMRQHDLLAVPVVDVDGRMKGIVTIDDVLDVVREEATEDIQKLGGLEALSTPYFQTGLRAMLRKRGGWLSLLFVGEMLTATAMSYFEHEIARAVVLAVFVPLIISSGGNSGSQASTLVIRAMALGEMRTADWWRVVRREMHVGLWLGVILASLGALRIGIWHWLFGSYADTLTALTATVAISLVGVVAWGTIAGCTLPFILRRAGFDPASASAPFVATTVDVTGLIIYFTVARFILLGA